MPIDTVDDLQEHLQLAIAVELATIPPYLYALYSIEDPSEVGAKYIRSVATEEMLHATLMANISLATGGNPRFYDPSVMPTYPAPWPNKIPELMLHLERLTDDVVRTTFLGIEAPGSPDAPLQPDLYESQGQFYHAVEQSIVALAENVDLFAEPQRDRQLHDPDGYVVVKYDAGVEWGDSWWSTASRPRSPRPRWPSTRVRASTRSATPTPSTASSPTTRSSRLSSTARSRSGRCCRQSRTRRSTPCPPTSRSSRRVLQRRLQLPVRRARSACSSPSRDDRHHLVAILYGVMVAMLGPVSRYLMTIPATDDEVWGPPFAYHQFADPARAGEELRAMGDLLRRDHPALGPALRHLERL